MNVSGHVGNNFSASISTSGLSIFPTEPAPAESTGVYMPNVNFQTNTQPTNADKIFDLTKVADFVKSDTGKVLVVIGLFLLVKEVL